MCFVFGFFVPPDQKKYLVLCALYRSIVSILAQHKIELDHYRVQSITYGTYIRVQQQLLYQYVFHTLLQ